jgi:hypothetical protein
MSRKTWVGNKAKNKFKKTIQNVIKDLSRRVVVYLSDKRSECNNCYYDKVNDRSSGVCKVGVSDPNYFTVGRCPVCRGRGVVVTSRKKYINANVVWDPTSESLNVIDFSEAGREGVTKVQIKTDPCYLELIRDCKKVVIDGVSCRISNPPSIRGLGNKSILVTTFFTDNKMKKGEYI